MSMSRRNKRHTIIALLSAFVLFATGRFAPAERPVVVLSMLTAYVGMALLAASLTLGPLNVLRRRPNPVSSETRRIVGIWCAIFAIAHIVFGLQVHMGGKFWKYFIFPPPHEGFPVRSDPFGLTNYAGLIGGLILLMLLLLSNDVSLRTLGTKRWKAWQRFAYLAFVLVIAHGAIYQLLEKRQLPYVTVFVGLCAAAVALQALGYGHRRGDVPPAS